jgi:diguanylate cyclase (GGDEF)-like protein/PAS domain S-box-containing protein
MRTASISPSGIRAVAATTRPEFHRRVLERLATPVIVVGADGTITYGNQAAADLSGWSLEDGTGLHMLELIHPDDVDWVVATFTEVLTEAKTGRNRGEAWSADGGIQTIEVTGADALDDPDVDGLIYSLRSCRDDELLDEILMGVAAAQPIDAAVPPVIERLLLPPLRFAAAVYEVAASGHVRCVDASDPLLASLPFRRDGAVPWGGLDVGPSRVAVADLPPGLAGELGAAVYRSAFYAAAHAPDLATSLVVVAVSPDVHDTGQGPIDRLQRAQALLATVLSKAHNDRRIRNDAHRDDLTGLPNRVALHQHLRHVATTTDDAAMLFVDIDGFKLVNDEHGHQVGDRVLAAIATRLEGVVRPDDFVCRLGGDEFAVVLSDAEGRLADQTVGAVADRIVGAIVEPISCDGALVSVSASVGAARLGPERDVDLLIGSADGAMYRAKRAGGGRHHFAPA